MSSLKTETRSIVVINVHIYIYKAVADRITIVILKRVF